MRKLIIYTVVAFVFFASCREDHRLFRKVSASHSHITFENRIVESDSFNIIDLENIYNGGGVAVADFNRDGLADLYFTGNMVSNKLYLNKGNLAFDDITSVSGVEGEGKWCRGVSVIDINNDGWQDIYLSATIHKDEARRENILYINKGADEKGNISFVNLAREYGLHDASHTTQTAFFDYDNDGDLDAYLAVNVFAKRDDPNAYRRRLVNGEHPNTDRLYRNDWDSVRGHPFFTNVSHESGILEEGFAHSVTICDINLDGWKDVFVANDYLSENLLYINNRNGTFTNRSKDYFNHTSFNSMGADVVDIDNDGLSDVIELDMNPEDNFRKKTMLGPGKYQTYINNENYDYQYQYVRNCLQLNRGKRFTEDDSSGIPVFSEIGFYSGIAETDWSWTPLVADFDNDGFRDLIVTNGFPKDITDRDFMVYRNSAFAMNAKSKLLSQIPEVRISNYAFRNLGVARFENSTDKWGLNEPSFSNGAASADLDNDGDLDIIVNNINENAFLYENTLNDDEPQSRHYLKVHLQAPPPNTGAFGAWIRIYYNGNKQFYEVNPVRGYLSSVNTPCFFGLGKSEKIDSLHIIWPDNTIQKLVEIKADTLLVITKDKSVPYYWNKAEKTAWFTETAVWSGIAEQHSQHDHNDFTIQPLLPHKLSQYGPPIVAGDVNGDGLDDIVLGGSGEEPVKIYLQQPDGKFRKGSSINDHNAATINDMGMQLFDAEGDGDLDLYVSVGGYLQPAGSALYRDKLFVNDGKGKFLLHNNALPHDDAGNSCVRAADYDNDGDADLFIGGRIKPGQYPLGSPSRLLRNDSKPGLLKFTDVTSSIVPMLSGTGMVCDALWTDLDKNGYPDLVIAGEWMPVRIFMNHKGVLTETTDAAGLSGFSGFWNCVAAADVDNDGDTDIVAGNAGVNTFLTNDEFHPVRSYYYDFDKNSIQENITTKYMKSRQGEYREFTLHSRDDIVDQLPSLKKRFLSFKSFAETDLSELFSKQDIEASYKLQANYFRTSYIENLGDGQFRVKALPDEAQFAPVFAIVAGDFNADGHADLFLNGNDYGIEVFSGRADAMHGLVLKGNGKGDFETVALPVSGVYVPGDGKGLAKLTSSTGQIMVVSSSNRDSVRVFRASAMPNR